MADALGCPATAAGSPKLDTLAAVDGEWNEATLSRRRTPIIIWNKQAVETESPLKPEGAILA